MNNELIIIQQLSKSFDAHRPLALKNIEAKVVRGEIIALAGPDGSGKTTLIRLLAGLLKPTQGGITIEGFDTIKNSEAISALIGYMPQKFGLYEDLTVIQNLNLYANLKNLDKRESAETFKKLLGFTGLTPFTDRFAKALSGGMKQKLGLACALLSKPTLLLLDEPTVGVDPISRIELWKMVQGLISEGITVVWSTSYLDEAERCHSVMLLNEGQLLYHGAPTNFTERMKGRVFTVQSSQEHKRKLLTSILQQKNVLDGTIQGDSIRIVMRKQGDSLVHCKESPSLTKLRQSPGVERSKTAPYYNIGLFSIVQPRELSRKFCGTDFPYSVLDESTSTAPLIPCQPRFEDAFVDLIGGSSPKVSVLTAKFPQIKENDGLVVEARNLTKQFGNFTAANNISFTVQRGEIFGLLGPNGAGKSTTFKMLCGLLKPTFGEALVNGINLQTAASKGRAHIGYMAQKFSLYDNLSVKQNLDFFSRIYNLSGEKQKLIVEEMINIFNLKQFLNESAENLPLGFKQRLALSCAVMHHPKVLFLDEPTSGVDPITRREFWSHINGLVEKGVTIVVTTHFMDEAEYCDRIGLVYRSQLIKVGTPDALKEAVKTADHPYPSLENAFILLIQQYEEEHGRKEATAK
jgi:ABC-2 type transport system ATP-binding protein